MKDRKLKLNLDDLLTLPGINTAKACAILSTLELARRQNIFTGVSIKKPADILPLVMKYGSKKQEHLVCFSLNGAGGVIEERVVSIGILNSTLIHPREVFADALSDRAASIILVHNHPSGIIEASSEDRELTKKLVEAGKILGIPLLDHIIITKEGKYFSFQENNALDTSF
jgi:DNA repair protein RadC